VCPSPGFRPQRWSGRCPAGSRRSRLAAGATVALRSAHDEHQDPAHTADARDDDRRSLGATAHVLPLARKCRRPSATDSQGTVTTTDAERVLPGPSMMCSPRTARRWWWRRCLVTPQCAFISIAATDAGRGRQTLLVRVKATVGSTFAGTHTPRIIPCVRSCRKPVVEHDHANGKERQSHC